MKLNSSETQRLVDRCRNGEERAFGRLFERHRPFLMQVAALRMPAKLRSRIDPSDIVQDAQLEAVRRVGEYLSRQDVSFRLWLRRITYELVLTAWRRHGQAARRSVDKEVALPRESSVFLANSLMSKGHSPSARFEKDDVAERVRRAVSRLSEVNREIVLLHNFEGLTSAESALVLNIEPAAARKRYGRALLKLRELLIDEGLPESQS